MKKEETLIKKVTLVLLKNQFLASERLLMVKNYWKFNK